MPFDTRFCDGYLTIKPRKSQKVNKTLTPRSSANNIHHVQNIFHKTVEEGDMTQVKVLLRYAQTNIHLEEPNKHGRTAVQECCLKDNLEMIRLLLDHGASLESTDAYGWTALHYASFFGSLNIVRFLVLNCADLMQTNNSGEMAYDLAQNDAVKYYLHRMMMLRSDDDDDDDDDDVGGGYGGGECEESDYRDTDGDERTSDYTDEDYFENSSDKLTWRHDSDNESLLNSISVVDSCESQASSPSWEEMRPVSPNQCMFRWLGKTETMHTMKGTTEQKVFQAEGAPKLGELENNPTGGISQGNCGAADDDGHDDDDDHDGDDDNDDADDDNDDVDDNGCKRISVICRDEFLKKSREVASTEEELNKEKNIAQEIARNGERELEKGSKNYPNNHSIVVSNEKAGSLGCKYDNSLVTKNEQRKGDNEDEIDCISNVPIKSCEIQTNIEKRKIAKIKTRGNIKQKVTESECKVNPKIVERKVDESGFSPRDTCNGEVQEKDKKKKNKEKNRSKIPSAIPRFKKRILKEKEDSKKLSMLNKQKGSPVSTTSEGLNGSRSKDKSCYGEERSKKGLEGLWERFRLLAARRNSNE